MATIFVDNKKLYEVLVDWNAKLLDNADTPIPEYVGASILNISNGLAQRWNFVGYTDLWREAMVSDGIEVCVKNIRHFDVHKFSNPHAYLSQICFRAFINRIRIEKRDAAIKDKYFMEHVYDSNNEEFNVNVDMNMLSDMSVRVDEYDRIARRPTTERIVTPGGLDFLDELDCDDELELDD